MDKKIREITITILLENETSLKFNSWANNCFRELDKHYTLAAINSGIVYRFPNLYANGLKDTSAIIDPFYDNKSRMGKPILINWIEVGANLKVIITFPADPRIINPLWDILFELCNDFPYLRDTVPHLLRDIKNKCQFEIPDIPLPVETVNTDAIRVMNELQKLLNNQTIGSILTEGSLPISSDTAKTEKPKQKGRYRLTPEDIKARKKIVKEAEKQKRDNPRKTWKEISFDMDIPERTLRDYRHQNYN